jgi:hypothetical protein
MSSTPITPHSAQPGFSPSGLTLAVATSSDLTLWTRPGLHFDD